MRTTVRRLRDRLGVRAVSALAAAAAVAVVLVVAGIALVFGLQRTLTGSVEATAKGTAEQLGQRVEANFSGTGDPKKNAIDATGKRTDIVQVVTAYSDETNAPDSVVGSNGEQQDIQVLGSSDPLEDQPQIVPWLLAPGETRTAHDVEIRKVDGTVENALVFGEGFRANGRPITVYAAEETASVTNAVDTVQWLLVGGVPVLVLITGYFTYLFAGGALRPVERMRVRVAAMDEKDLSQRVPEPIANDEVGRLARTMNQMLGRIESSQATQRRFVADASHELRSPLATVSTGLELLGAGTPADSADRATVQTLRGETARLTGLVEGLLFLARADERGLTPRREEVDLDEIVEAERVRPTAPSAEPSVTVRVTAEPVRVVGDRGQLVRVLRNLVDNAKRHAVSTVAVAARAEDGVAVIEVEDDGNGVPEADRHRVFERFVRLDEARSRGDGGSGLGLSIVSELVAAHGGTVAVLESSELGGARFRVTVPIVDAAPRDPDAEAEPGTGSAADEPGATPAGAGPVETDVTSPVVEQAEPERDPWTGPAAPTSPADGDRTPGRPVMGRRPAGPPVPTTPDPEDHPVPDPQAQHRPDPPTGPLPIRPDTVGSPYDENATRPIPVHGSAAASRSSRTGTAVASRDGERPADAPRPGDRIAGQRRPPQPRGHRDDRR